VRVAVARAVEAKVVVAMAAAKEAARAVVATAAVMAVEEKVVAAMAVETVAAARVVGR